MLWLLWSFLSLVLPVQAQQIEITDIDRTAIRSIIAHQLAAFQQDDAVKAFSFASPGIQSKFGTPDNFMHMVKTSYRAVYRPQTVVFKELVTIEGTPTQQVLLVDPDGVPVLALYPMEKQADGGWKIDGCYLLQWKRETL
jgi:hypothetical protein